MQPNFDQVYPVLYKGWDPTAARADFNAGGWQNKAGAQQFMGGGGSDINKTTENSFQQLMTEMINKYNAYKSSNPFSLDESLANATAQAKEQIDPYYNESLNDYVTGVTRKIGRSKEDAQDMLGQLSADTESYTGSTKLKLSEAINKTQQGFADAGIYNSGQELRNEGLLKVGANQDMSDFLRNQDYKTKGINTSLARNVEDLTAAKTQNVRDLERQRYTDVSTRAKDIQGEMGQQYVAGFKATLPPELQAQSGFDIMKDIGIYN